MGLYSRDTCASLCGSRFAALSSSLRSALRSLCYAVVSLGLVGVLCFSSASPAYAITAMDIYNIYQIATSGASIGEGLAQRAAYTKYAVAANQLALSRKSQDEYCRLGRSFEEVTGYTIVGTGEAAGILYNTDGTLAFGRPGGLVLSEWMLKFYDEVGDWPSDDTDSGHSFDSSSSGSSGGGGGSSNPTVGYDVGDPVTSVVLYANHKSGTTKYQGGVDGCHQGHSRRARLRHGEPVGRQGHPRACGEHCFPPFLGETA